MRAEISSFQTPDVLIFPLENLESLAKEGDGEAFYMLLEKAYYGEVGALEVFHRVVTSHPSHFYRLAQFLSHPEFSHIVFKIIEHPDFDFTPLKAWVETEPALLMIVSGLAFEKDHGGALKLLPQLKFDASVYQKAVEEDCAYAAFLSLIAERGYANVQDLLIQLVQDSGKDVFFAFVGVAAEGSLTALQAINEGATVAHLIAMADFARRYETEADLVAPLMHVLRQPGFCPRELWNPSTQKVLKESGVDSILTSNKDSEPLKKASGE